jgi:hypothetical protein
MGEGMSEDRVLTEHEAVNNEEFKEPEQSPSERKLIKKINEMFQRAKAHREKYDHKWLDYYKLFRGRQWKEERPVYRHSEVLNIIFSTIQHQVPILTDSRPKFEYLAQEPSDIEFAKILNHVAEHDWNRFNWLNEETESLYDGHIFGTGLGELTWDEKGDQGIGAIKFNSFDPVHAYPDPKARDVNKECDFFISAKPMHVDQVKKLWPKKGKFVKPDIDTDKFDKTDLDKVRFKSPTENVIYESDRPADTINREALVIECFYRDDEMEEEKRVERIEVDTPEGPLIQERESFLRKKKYPFGRRTIIAGNVLLQDGPNPYEDGEFPYQKYSNYILPREFWGESEVAQLEGPQKVFNKIYSFVLDVMTLTGNPIWILDDDSGVDPDMLYNRPGLIVEKSPGSEVRRESGVQLQPYVIQIMDRVKAWIDDVSGATDVTRGATPAGVKAGIAISALQEAAQTRLRQKSRNLDVFLQNLGQQYKSRVLQFYSAPRIVRLTNDENSTKYFRFNIEKEVDENGQEIRVARIQDFVQNEFDDSIRPAEERRIVINGDFDVKINTGTLLPFNREAKEAKLLNYFDRGLIDAEEVLKNTEDFPNWEAILQEQPQVDNELEAVPTEDLVTGIHDGMLQLLQNVEASGQASPAQKQSIAQALQSFRAAVSQLGGGEQPAAERLAGGNVTPEEGVAETLPAG